MLLGVLNVYCTPLFRRTAKGRNGVRSAIFLMPLTFIVAKLIHRSIAASQKAHTRAVRMLQRRYLKALRHLTRSRAAAISTREGADQSCSTFCPFLEPMKRRSP